MEKILVIGGTNFIGRNLIMPLLKEKGIHLTLFNRGITNAELFPEINRIQGDRNSDDVKQIGKTNWDYIIDLSCYYPNSLAEILKTLTAPPKHYIFISTCSVYDSQAGQHMLRGEHAARLSCSETEKTDLSTASYGNRKAACERILEASNLNYTVLRPALVYGDYDPTDRFYYWLYQVKKSETLLMPENGKGKFSVTYVHDLVDVILAFLNPTKSRKAFNIISNPSTSIEEIVEITKRLLNQKPAQVNANATFLNQHEINEWVDMPLWINHDFFTFDNAKLKRAIGFSPTQISTGISETITHYKKRNWPEPKYGIAEKLRLDLIKKAL